jgi:hypothetical protein
VHGRHPLVGSWLVTYDVEAFGVVIPILLSFGRDGVVIETDSPAPTPVGPLGTLILSNGHGAWQPRAEKGTFAYLYRKLIYQQDGLTPFGTTKTRHNQRRWHAIRGNDLDRVPRHGGADPVVGTRHRNRNADPRRTAVEGHDAPGLIRDGRLASTGDQVCRALRVTVCQTSARTR